MFYLFVIKIYLEKYGHVFFNVHMNMFKNMSMIISTGCAKMPVFRQNNLMLLLCDTLDVKLACVCVVVISCNHIVS